MAGEIHGQITREDAWRMWKPYGERVELDGELEPENLSPYEIGFIAKGTRPNFVSEFINTMGIKPHEYRPDTITRELANDPKPELIEIMVRSHADQQQLAEKARREAIEQGLRLISMIGRGVLVLAKEGFFTAQQVDTIQSRLIGPDGQPYFQYTPMSALEYARLGLKYDGEELDLFGTDCTDFSFGVVRSYAKGQDIEQKQQLHNRVHEFVHTFSGVELWDITNTIGWRKPDACVIGHFAYEPNIGIGSGNDFTDVEDVETCEGWTDYTAQELMRVQPELGQPLKGARYVYSRWSAVMAELKEKHPELFRHITDAGMYEANPLHPGDKRLALDDMHEHADAVLGKGILEKMLKEV